MAPAALSTINAAIRKHVIPLNNSLPDEFGRMWVTGEEIHGRLVHSGVHRTLKLSHVQDALQHNNTGEMFLKPWEYGGNLYFRPTLIYNEYPNELPLQQRFKQKQKAGRQNRININPERNYFITHRNRHFDGINEQLEKLEEEEEADMMRKKSM
jgi:hypothetical protein